MTPPLKGGHTDSLDAAKKKRKGTPEVGTPKEKMPDWLRRILEAKHPASFGRHAWWEICGLCGHVVLTGWDAYDDYAGKFKTDPAQLDTLAELAAVWTGRHTFELRTDADGNKTISRRDHHRIIASPASEHRWPVIPEHRCRQPLGARLEPRKLSGKQNAQAPKKN